jgi:small conductance mechanosensitive channel
MLVVVTGMVILRELGFDIGPIIAGAGIVGLAIGFGAQHLVKDVISGFFILLENQYRVGDTVELNGKSGLVESVNLRTTVLRDQEGRVHIVPNGSIVLVTNTTRGWARVVVDVSVSYRESVDRVMDVLREVGEGMEADPKWTARVLEPLEIAGVQSLGGNMVDIRVTMKVRPDDRFTVARELRRRIKNRFDELEIDYSVPPLPAAPAPRA